MKKVATNQPNKIISRIKEGFEGFLSIFDGNKYTTSEGEAHLPEALIKSLESLGDRAGRYQNNGFVDLPQENTKQQSEYPPLETPRITPTKQYQGKTQDHELEL